MKWRRLDPYPTSWIGRLFEWIPGRPRCVVPAVFYGLLVLVAGLGIAAIGGFAPRYLATREVWILTGVTAWVLSWGYWSTGKLRSLPDDIAPALRHPRDPEYYAYADWWVSRAMKAWPSFAIGALFLLFVLWRIWFDTNWLEYFPSSWGESDGDLVYERLVLTLFFAVGSPLFITMLWGFAHYVEFSWCALQRPLTLAPSLARMHLRPITSFGLWVSLGWSVAVTLATLFFVRNVNWDVAAALSVLGIMGISLIVAPQVFAHHALIRTRNELVDVTAPRLQAQDPSTWVDQYVVGAPADVQHARSFLAELNQAPVWIYVPAEAIAFAAGILVPIGTLVLSVVLGE